MGQPLGVEEAVNAAQPAAEAAAWQQPGSPALAAATPTGGLAVPRHGGPLAATQPAELAAAAAAGAAVTSSAQTTAAGTATSGSAAEQGLTAGLAAAGALPQQPWHIATAGRLFSIIGNKPQIAAVAHQ